mmetsp:Transcript_19697/g.34594  ORF Transcript_19697/g.34594 Transcript_19697/m.34594 type:complete len:202 (+) Transcript_19697:45-650(+)
MAIADSSSNQILLAGVIVALTAGFALGFAFGKTATQNIVPSYETSKTQEEIPSAIEEEDDAHDSEDEDNVLTPGQIINNYSFLDGAFKMVFCVNMDLKMGKGKIAAQCGHATLGAYLQAKKHSPSAVKCWEWIGQKKIAVKCPDLDQLLEAEAKARAAGLITYVVRDAGHTQIAAGSQTVLAIGPAPEKAFAGVSDHFKLL